VCFEGTTLGNFAPDGGIQDDVTKTMFGHIPARLGAWSAHPAAFTIVIGYAILWLLIKRETFDRHALATLAT
jgi:hypothetical protein